MNFFLDGEFLSLRAAIAQWGYQKIVMQTIPSSNSRRAPIIFRSYMRIINEFLLDFWSALKILTTGVRPWNKDFPFRLRGSDGSCSEKN